MAPLEFLREEFENVRRALDETLRHDYGPGRVSDYYNECASRLTSIEKALLGVPAGDAQQISDLLGELSSISFWIALRERSRLGEFSWPFEDVLRHAAQALLADKNLSGSTIAPVVHVVSDGIEYQINYEPSASSSVNTHRFVTISFPRPLKHHVLFHSLFGHELGHAALDTSTSGAVLYGNVLTALSVTGPLSSAAALNAWLHDKAAPADIQAALTVYSATRKILFQLTDRSRAAWLEELMCDLFGLATFGPAFVAAHRAFLMPIHPRPYHVRIGEPASTHPPFACRHKMLIRALNLLAWDTPCTSAGSGAVHRAEMDLMNYLMDDPYVPWAQLLTDSQITAAMSAIQRLIASQTHVGYRPPTADTVSALVTLLAEGVPPIQATLEDSGKPLLRSTPVAQTLYAGWAYWLGRTRLATSQKLSFFETNRLCDHALMQQSAIDLVIKEGVI